MSPDDPRTIAAVVVTIGRPELLRAVESITRQTHPVDEIIVVADTLSTLSIPEDGRIRVVRIGPGAGAGIGRQQGVNEATCDIIALLDDDDWWLPSKVERLMEDTQNLDGDWIASSRVEAHGLGREPLIWPARTIKPAEPVVEYLFLKHRLRGGTGFIQSSCLAFTRNLALQVPFDPELRFHQDVGWVVDVAHARPDVPLIQSEHVLSAYYVAPGTGSVSHEIRALESVAWALNRLEPDGPRVVGDFILTHSLILAERSRSVRLALKVVREALTHGRPGWPACGYAVIAVLRTAASKLRASR